MKFTKMHGLGNDYVYINGFEQDVADPAGLAIAVSDRHFGIGVNSGLGGDSYLGGLVLICLGIAGDIDCNGNACFGRLTLSGGREHQVAQKKQKQLFNQHGEKHSDEQAYRDCGGEGRAAVCQTAGLIEAFAADHGKKRYEGTRQNDAGPGSPARDHDQDDGEQEETGDEKGRQPVNAVQNPAGSRK